MCVFSVSFGGGGDQAAAAVFGKCDFDDGITVFGPYPFF